MLTYRIINAYFQYLKCLLKLFFMPTYNILKIYNGSSHLETVSQECVWMKTKSTNKNI